MENLQENSKIEIGHEALGYLNTTRKWTMFFAILGFVAIGLMLLGGLFAGALFKGAMSGLSGMEGMEGMEGMDVARSAGGFAGTMVFILILVFAVIYFFPMFYLLKFSTLSKNAIANLDSSGLTQAFKHLKSYWVYLGILVIIVLAIYLLIFIIAGGATMAFMG
jgi:hypothetical protein